MFKMALDLSPIDRELCSQSTISRLEKNWSRVERIIARVEAGAEGRDTRFVVTNLSKRNARWLYEDVPAQDILRFALGRLPRLVT